MTINASFTFENGILFTKATGRDETIEDVLRYGQSVIEQAVLHQAKRILVDETELEYRLGTFDVYTSAKSLAEHAPHVAKSAMVVTPAQVTDAKFFETVAVNRGLNVRMFTDMAEAKEWLEKE